MKKLVVAILLIGSPAWAQTKLSPKAAAARVDPCEPIGRTAKGELVYSLKCDNIPAPPPPPQEAEPAPTPAEPADKGGLLGKFPLDNFGTFGRSPPGTPPPVVPAGH